MAGQGFRIRPIESDEDLERMLDTTALAFEPGYLRARRDFASHQSRPRHRRALSRILEVDGQIVSSVLIADKGFRIGDATFRLGGIADVATHPDFRNQGHCRRLMDEVVTFMTEDGFDLSILFGIRDFYYRFGYATALCDTSLRVPTKHARTIPADLTTRPAQREDLPLLAALLDAELARRACGFTRDEEDWRFRLGVPSEATVLEEAGRPVGYFVANEEAKELYVGEVAVEPSAPAYRTLLAVCGRRASEAGKETLRFDALAPSHPFARYCALLGADHDLHFPRVGSGMARILRLEDTLRKFTPEMERRLASSPLASDSIRFTLRTDLGELGLTLDRGRVELGRPEGPAVELPQWSLMRLMLGYATPSEAAMLGEATVPEDVLPWAEALFPRAWPTVINADGF